MKILVGGYGTVDMKIDSIMLGEKDISIDFAAVRGEDTAMVMTAILPITDRVHRVLQELEYAILEYMTTGFCSRCGLPIPSGEEERCWWCGAPLCFSCWDKYGECGHPEAIEWKRAIDWPDYKWE